MTWPARALTAIRSLWVFVGITLLVVVLAALLLDDVLPDEDDDGPDPAPRYTADAYAGQDWVRALYREQRRAKARWAPYVHWRRRAFGGEFIHVDERGLRRTWNPELPESAPRVYMFGGSTLWGTGARDEHTIPSWLSRLLHERGVAARVVNFGEGGYVSTQGLVTLVRELQAGRVPELAIFYDGVNDVASAYQNGRAGLPQNEPNRRAEFNLSRDAARLAAAWSRCALPGVDKLRRWLSGERWQPPSDLDALAGEVLDAYAGGMRVASGLARAFDFSLRYYWQPTVYSKATLSAYEAGVRERRPEQHALFDRVADEVVRSRALRGDPRFRDLTRLFDDTAEPVYIDFCHLGESANARVAETMLEDVVADLRARHARQ